MIKFFTSTRLRALLAGGVLSAGCLCASAATDFTDFIVNPSFESAFAGWEQTGMQAQNNQTFPLKEGNNYVERWVSAGNGAGDCKVEQKIEGLFPGSYSLKAAAQNLQEGSDEIQTGVWIFAGEKRTPVNVVADYTVDFTVGADGTVTLGYVAENATGNYLATDNFRLTFVDFDKDALATFYANTIAAANELKSTKMGKDELNALQDAVTAFEQAYTALDAASMADALKQLRAAEAAAKTSAEAYAALKQAIEDLKAAYEEVKGQEGAEEIANLIANAEKTYQDATATEAELEELVNTLENAILIFRVNHGTGLAPVVTTETFVARGATFALGRATFKAPEGGSIKEKGFCWATHPNPTIADFHSTKKFKHNGDLFYMKGMKPSTVYYVCAYAISDKYAAGYGNVVKVITIPKGTITYSYNPNDATEDQTRRIVAALEEAVDVWNNATSITGFHVTCSYNGGVNTADCSYGGWVRVGPRENYQATGTLLHEMNHGVGVGQHEVWYGPSSPYRETGTSGLWQGPRANRLVQFLQNNPEEKLHGDTQHMWPYGINGAHEDDGTEILYLANGLVTQALGEDALPPVAGRFHTAAYTFPSDDDTKYYLKNENTKLGAYTSYLVEGDNNVVEWTELDADGALADDRAAWYLAFDPVTCHYTLRNASTGNYLIWRESDRNKVYTAATPAEGEVNEFQFTPSIGEVTVGNRHELTYWITVRNTGEKPRALALGSTGNLIYTNYKYVGNTVSQCWHILSEAEVPSFASLKSATVASDEALFPADVYDLTGRLVRPAAENLEGLHPGVYLVGTTKVYVK